MGSVNDNYRFHFLDSWRQLLAYLGVIAIVITFSFYLYYQARSEEIRALIAVEEQHHVQIQRSVLQSDLRHVAYILSYLRDQIRLHGHGDLDADRLSFSQDIYSFMLSNELYDQIRFIAADGMEVVRVDYNQGHPALIMQQELQFKGDKYYFRKSMELGENEIYISRLDLNMEHGKVELPYKPVIRFGMPVYSEEGDKLGVLMVNHLASSMLEAFKVASSPSHAFPMLLNDQGFWLYHPEKSKQWGFMFEASRHVSMSRQSPELWHKALAHEDSQFDHDGDMVTVGTIYPYDGFTSMGKIRLSETVEGRYWKVVSVYPKAMLNAEFDMLKRRVGGTAIFSMLLSLFVLLVWRASNQRRNRSEIEREKLLCELRHLSRKLIDHREEEASRIGRALHDDVGQVLAAIQLQIGIVERCFTDEDYVAAKESVGRIKQMSSDLSLVIRKQLYAIKPGHLEEIGLVASIEELCREWHEQLDVTLIIEELSAEELPEKLQLCLFRVVQEALTNAIKHSEASKVELSLRQKPQQICFQYRDNGKGFDQKGVGHGMGLTGMRERVNALGGTMHLDSQKNSGLLLEVELPLP